MEHSLSVVCSQHSTFCSHLLGRNRPIGTAEIPPSMRAALILGWVFFGGVVFLSMSMVCFGWSTTLKKLDIRAPGGSCQKVLVYRLALRTAFVSIYSHACSVSPWQKFATTTTTSTTTTTATTATTTARDHRDHCDHHDRHDRHDPHDHRDHDPTIGRLRFPAGRLCARGAVESNDEKA